MLTMFLLAFLVFSVIGQTVAADANDESRLNYIYVQELLSHDLLTEQQQTLVNQLDNTGANVEQILASLHNIELALEDSEANIDALIAEAQGLELTDFVTSFTEVKEANQELEQEIDTLLDTIDNDRDAQHVTADNCPANANVNQADADDDDIGDVCDSQDNRDTDSDGVQNWDDNCPTNANTNQANVDGDSLGDVCDTNPTDGPLADTDSDGDANGVDNCPVNANADQADTDRDGIGNVCDTTPNGETTTLTYQQRYNALETDLNDYEDDYDEDLEDNYNDAVRKDDEDDIEDAEDDLEQLKDDLKTLRDQARDLEDEVEEANDDEEYDNLLDDIGDLIDDITAFRDDVSALLSGETTDTNTNDFDYVSDYTPPRTTTPAPTGNVVLEPLEVPNLVLAGQDQTTTGTQWESIRNMVFIAGGVVILLAIILFLIALLVR